MIYRQLDTNGDYTFGNGIANFWVNQPEAPAQAVLTRLRLQLGEWFLDTSDGTNYATGVLGKYTEGTRDAILRGRILGTPGVTGIVSFSSSTNTNTRTYSVNVTVNTQYGQVTVSGAI